MTLDVTFSATDLAVIQHRFAAIPREMGAVLTRMAYSPNIKERQDFSCALFDASGQLLAQAAHIPVHLGAMPRSVEAVLSTYETLAPGDVVMLNDPFHGGSHLPDITMVSPLFLNGGGPPAGYAATRAHHADVGGLSPGSLPDSESIFQEGLRIPPVKLCEKGEVVEGVLRLLCANSRSPLERQGDVRAQLQAHHLAGNRWADLVKDWNREQLTSRAEALNGVASRQMEALLKTLPRGEWKATAHLEGKASEEGCWLRGRLRISEDGVEVDLCDSDDAMQGSLNTVHAVCESAVHYLFLCLLAEELPEDSLPVCGGAFSQIHVKTRPGSILHALPPHAVAGGNVETSQRLVDLGMDLLAQACPGRIPALSQGTMNNVTLGGMDAEGIPFAYYETLGGGAGGGPEGPGAHAIQVHMTNTLNTPVEALEYAYPLRVRTYCLRERSGGAGHAPGGMGLVREWEALVPVEVSLLTQRRQEGVPGRDGGGDGRPGTQGILRVNGTWETLDNRGHWHLCVGDRLRVETPGGGGYGFMDER